MASNHLFELIHSLSPTEKGYIKKKAFTSTKGEEIFYIKLFNAIASQTEYDEEKLAKKFKGEAFLKNFSKNKNHLYNLILKRLTHYHEENLIDIKIKSALNQAIILHKKGLYEQALVAYEKALKMALEEEELQTASQIYSKMLDIYFVGKMGVTFPYQKEYDELSEKIKKEQKITYLNTKIAELMFSDNFNTDEKNTAKIHQLMNHSVMNEIGPSDSFLAQWGKGCLLSHGNYLLKNHAQEMSIKMQQLQLLHQHQHLNNRNPLRYIKHLVNLLNVKLNVGDLESMPPLLYELKNFQSGESLYHHLKPLQTSTYYIQYLCYLTQGNMFEKAHLILEEAVDWFAKNDALVSDYFKIIFYNNAFIIYFSRGQYKQCFHWLNLLLNSKTEFRKEFRLCMKFNQLLLHFELKNFELITYQIKAIYRELLKQNNNQETGKYILRWFQNCLKNINADSDLKKEAEEIKIRLEKMIHNGEWKILTEMSLFLAWIDSKIYNQPVSDCYSALFKKEIAVV